MQNACLYHFKHTKRVPSHLLSASPFSLLKLFPSQGPSNSAWYHISDYFEVTFYVVPSLLLTFNQNCDGHSYGDFANVLVAIISRCEFLISESKLTFLNSKIMQFFKNCFPSQMPLYRYISLGSSLFHWGFSPSLISLWVGLCKFGSHLSPCLRLQVITDLKLSPLRRTYVFLPTHSITSQEVTVNNSEGFIPTSPGRS